jgi:tetratricopeptide repeat protein
VAIARDMDQQALDMYRWLHRGTDHPDIASALNSLAVELRALGERPRALNLHEQAGDMNRRLYGDADHPSIAYSPGSLAADLRALGEPERLGSWMSRPWHTPTVVRGDRRSPTQHHNLGHSGHGSA